MIEHYGTQFLSAQLSQTSTNVKSIELKERAVRLFITIFIKMDTKF